MKLSTFLPLPAVTLLTSLAGDPALADPANHPAHAGTAICPEPCPAAERARDKVSSAPITPNTQAATAPVQTGARADIGELNLYDPYIGLGLKVCQSPSIPPIPAEASCPEDIHGRLDYVNYMNF